MGFLNPLALWGGLAAAGVAVPIIIHLLYRKNRKQTKWAAMELLRKALVVRSGQVKLEDFLILALRCLAILLIAGSLLRPTLKQDSIAGLGEQRVGMVIAIDSSYSMGHGEHSRFEKAVETARTILGTASEGDPVTIVRLSSHPEILVRRSGYDPGTFGDVLDGQKTPSKYRLGLETSVEQLRELIGELKTPIKECYIITDAQDADWATVSGEGAAIFEDLATESDLFVVPVSPESEGNLSLARLEYQSGALRAKATGRFAAIVRNEGRTATDGGVVELFVNDELVTRRNVGMIKAGEPQPVPFYITFDKPGDVRLKARLSKDDLMVDNERFGVVQVAPRVRALVVDGAPPGGGGDLSRAGAFYAVKGIQLRDRDPESPLTVSQVEASNLSLENLSDFDVIVMTDVSDLAPEVVDRLRGFVSRGGGLVVFLGEQVDPELYNQRFGASGGGASGGSVALLPGTLGQPVSVSPDLPNGWTIEASKAQHSLAQIATRLKDGMLETARVTKMIQVEPNAEADVLWKVAEVDAPLALTHKVGGGEVVMVTTSADRSWNELPVHPLYSMFLQQAVTTLSSRPDERHFHVGGTVEIPVPGRKLNDPLSVTGPDGQTAELRVTASSTQGNQQVVCAIDASRVGVYTIAGGGGAGGEDNAPISAAVNVEAIESNVRVIDGGALTEQLEPQKISVIATNDAKAIEATIEKSREGMELADILLGLGIFAFLLQSILAKRFTDKIHAGESDLGASLQTTQVAAARRS